MHKRCLECGHACLPVVTRPGLSACRCGHTQAVVPTEAIDWRRLYGLAVDALARARVCVHAVPVQGEPGSYTLSVEPDARPPTGGLPRETALDYANAINGEAELARAMLRIVAEYSDRELGRDRVRDSCELEIPHELRRCAG